MPKTTKAEALMIKAIESATEHVAHGTRGAVSFMCGYLERSSPAVSDALQRLLDATRKADLKISQELRP